MESKRNESCNLLKIKAAMVENGITQSKLALELGLTLTTLNFKLNGKADFKVSELQKIASILNKEISYFF